MSQSAQVLSLELLQRLQAALARFGVGAQECLGIAALGLRHTQDVLTDSLRHWQMRVNRCQDEVSRAKSALSHARATKEGQRSGCVEQELDLRKALENLHQAEEKVKSIRRWQRELPDHTKDFETRARSLSGYLESDLRRSIAFLEKKLITLEAYMSIAGSTPSSTAPPPVEPQKEQPC